MSGAGHRPDQADGLAVVTIDEAVTMVKQWSWDGPSGLDGITDDEWAAFIEELESR